LTKVTLRPPDQTTTRHAYYLGLAFRIVDDILDIVGDPEVMGKPVHADHGVGFSAMVNGNGHHRQSQAVATAVPTPSSQTRCR